MCDATGDDPRPQSESCVETAAHMGRAMDTTGIKELLYRNYEHPRWDNVANRCLTCANCTMVCPTCFCSTVEDTPISKAITPNAGGGGTPVSQLSSPRSSAARVRKTARSRYRQWMTHKLATWIDQFGTSGCVGCGRCITWCPVAIDITEEVRAIRDTERAEAALKENQESDHASR